MKYDKYNLLLQKLLRMKRLTTDRIINIALLILFSSWGLYLLTPTALFRNHTSKTTVVSDTVYERANVAPAQMIKTGCDLCREQQDSIDRADELRNGKFRRDFGSPFGQPVRGFFYTDEEIIRHRGYENINKEPDYFFALLYWDLVSADSKHGTVMYYVENKQAHLNVFDYTQNKWGTRKSKMVPFKYDPKNKQILIPITESKYQTIRILFIFSAFVLLFPLYLFVIVGGILKFLLSVARGEVFTEKNIRRLKVVAFASFIMPLSSLIINYSYKFIFHKYFNEYIAFKIEFLQDQIKYFAIALICFLLYKAFNRGYKLQQENDFTV